MGVDRVTAESGVAKATLYQQFRSKDELVAACLQRRAEHWRGHRGRAGARYVRLRRRRVGAVFGRLGKAFAASGYRGCPFINAAAEYPGPDGPVAAAIAAHRAQVRGLFAELLAGCPLAAGPRSLTSWSCSTTARWSPASSTRDRVRRAGRQAAARHLLEMRTAA